MRFECLDKKNIKTCFLKTFIKNIIKNMDKKH